MRAGAASFRHIVLGLLARQPMSGYDIKRYLKSLNWLIGNPSSGILYPVLRALLQDSYATLEVRPHESRPPRKIYSITEAGRQELKEWTDRPVKLDVPLRAFLMRLILADSFTSERLAAQLEQRSAQVASQQAALARIMSAESGKVTAEQRLAFDYGMALASTELDWLEEKQNQLSRLAHQSLAMEVAGGDGIASPA